MYRLVTQVLNLLVFPVLSPVEFQLWILHALLLVLHQDCLRMNLFLYQVLHQVLCQVHNPLIIHHRVLRHFQVQYLQRYLLMILLRALQIHLLQFRQDCLAQILMVYLVLNLVVVPPPILLHNQPVCQLPILLVSRPSLHRKFLLLYPQLFHQKLLFLILLLFLALYQVVSLQVYPVVNHLRIRLLILLLTPLMYPLQSRV